MTETIHRTINKYVAGRLTKRRLELGLTQVQVAKNIGVSFQQYQKYEHGANRVAAGRLYMLADSLDTTVEYFFKGANTDLSGNSSPSESNVDTIESARLVRQFNAIPSAALKQTVLNMIRALEPAK